MSMSKKFVYDLGFKLDRKGLDEAIAALRQVQAEAARQNTSGIMEKQWKEASESASQLIDILGKSWNDKLGQLNLSTVNKEIKNTWKSVTNLQQSLTAAGTSGQLAFDKVSAQILHTNLQMRNSSKILDEMGQSFANTFKWGISSSVFNSLTGALGKAYSYAKNLDSSLNDIRIVTNQSASSMEKFAIQANKAAKDLGASTLDYTEAALIYYQQGLSDEEVAARTDVTLKAANVTGQSGSEVSEQLTAVWNGYNLANKAAKEGMGIYEEYVDKLAAVAATTASDLEEISVGMSKVASAANLMGVDIDQLNAQLATIVSVTRQAPESVGTALKTIYARMGDIEAGLDAETTLGTYSSEMADMGFNVLDASGKLRDMGDVIEEIGGKWSSMSREQQIALAQTMAGTRQYNNLLSLFDSWDMYESALKTSQEAMGTLNQQQAIYMESTEAHLAALSTAFEETYDILFDEEAFNGLISGVTKLVDVFNIFLDSLGGGVKTLGYFGALAGNIFSKQIGKNIEELFVENIEGAKSNKAQEQLYAQILQQYGYLDADPSKIQTIAATDVALEKELEYAEKIFKLRGFITEEEGKELSQLQEKIGALAYELDAIKTYKEEMTSFSQEVSKSNEKYADLDATSDITRWEQAKKDSSKDLGVAIKAEKLFGKNKDSFKTVESLNRFKSQDENAYNFLMNEGGIADSVRTLLLEKQAAFEKMQQEILNLEKVVTDAEFKKDALIEADKDPNATKEQKNKYLEQYVKVDDKAIKSQKRLKELYEEIDKVRKEGLLDEEELEFVSKRYAERKESTLKTQQKIKKIVEGMRQEEKTSEADLEAEQEQAERELQFKIQQEERQKLYAQGVQAITATVQGLYTLSSLFDILLDKETSFAQKLGSLVPLALSVITTFGQTANLITSLNSAMVAGMAKRTAIATVETAARTALNASLEKEAIIEAASAAAKKAGLKLSQEELITLLTRKGLIEANTAATTGDIAVKTADIGVTAALKAVQDKLNASMMKFPLMWILGAIAAVTAIVMGLVTAQQKRREEEYKLRQEQIEKLNETQEEIDKNLELVKSYEEIYKQYKSGKTSKQELEEATDSLNVVLEEEDLKIAKLTGNYEELIKKIDEYKKKKLEEGRDSAEEEVDKTGAQITSKAIEGQGHRESNNTKYSIDFDG